MDSLELQTDHKPLVPLISSKDLDKAPVRCQRLLLRLMPFNADVRYVPGKSLILAGLPIRNRRLEALRAATVHDADLQFIINCVLNGWLLNRSDIPADFRGYQQAQ